MCKKLIRTLVVFLIQLNAVNAVTFDGEIIKTTGKVINQTNEVGIGSAQVWVQEKNISVLTDEEGNFSLELPSGMYNFVISGNNFDTLRKTQSVSNNVSISFALIPKTETLKKITINVAATKASEAAVLNLQKKSLNVSDGLSAEAFKKIGDSDAGAAIKRVPGLSVEGGKYVFVRGLSDRYTKTQLNNLDLPGIDPDRNTVQMDIFPTNLIDNIIVTKTFSADLPGDFTGGLVNVITKDFPEKRNIALNFSLAYNPALHLQKGFLNSKTYSSDVFAFGNNNRQNPLPNGISNEFIIPGNSILDKATRSFSNEMSAKAKLSPFLDNSLSFSIGDKIKGKKSQQIGYSVALNYSANYRHYKNIKYSLWAKDRDKSIFEQQNLSKQTGSQSEQEFAWSGLGNISIKNKYSKYSISLFHSRNGLTQNARLLSRNTSINASPGAILDRTVLYYNQRDVSDLIISGSHSLGTKKFTKTLNWTIAPTIASNKEPDMRQTFFAIEDDGSYTLNIGDGAKVSRIWRALSEKGLNSKVDLEFKSDNLKWSNIKGGLSFNTKIRDFGVSRFEFRDIQPRKNYTGDANELFLNQNLYSAENAIAKGLAVQIENVPSNNYNSSLLVLASYMQGQYQYNDKLKAIIGTRLEQATMNYTGENQAGLKYDNKQVLNTLSVLPNLALIYSKNDNVNLRFNASRTLARPTFKEKSVAQIFDAVTNRTFIGNLDLEQTSINNFDIRWEKFKTEGQLLSASLFVKDFTNPIEIVAYKPETPDNFTARNVGKAVVAGIELEVRQALRFISSSSNTWFLSTNASYMYSSVRMNDAEYKGRKLEEKIGETISRNRRMQGQSPYLINATINYKNRKNWQGTLSYNVQGPRLSIVGITVNPDVFEKEFHSVNLNIQKSLGKRNQTSIGLMIDNMLLQKRIFYQKSFKAANQIFTEYSPFSTIRLNVRFTL